MVRPLEQTAPSTQFLLVHRDPTECRFIAECLRQKMGAMVESTSFIAEGQQLIAQKHFDLALIEVVLPDVAGIELAALAANQNVPVLLLSENSVSTDHARRLGYPYLEKPFDVDLLVAELVALMQRTRHAVREAAASGHRMVSAMQSLAAEVNEANRRFDLIMSRLRRK